MTFAEKLKLIRKERNVTQEELAEMLEVSRQAVSKWESGNGYPETEKLIMISNELNISLDYLLKDEAVLEEKEKEEPKAVVYVSGGGIAIPTWNNEKVVVCHAVKSSKIMFPSKDEPGFVLLGVDKVTFWGEHTTILGWYATQEEVQQEITGVMEAMNRGEAAYALKYAADVEFVGIFGRARVKK